MGTNSNEKIVSLFFTVSRSLKQKMDLSSPFFQLPLAHAETLRLIREKKRVPMKQVADFLAITPPSATALIGHLAKAGYVQRTSGKNDRRAVYLSLTKKGASVMQKAVLDHCKVFSKLLDKISDKEHLELLNILTKLAK
ncbi:MAG: MarR family transcriptional regulator [Candidatus Doudnabacteria bacterium]|nr:MarR family transcriptional regulator [Candidatus Doudnabacteria bacterium]